MLAMVAGFTSCGDDNNGNNKGEDMTTTQTFAMSAKTRINSVLIYDCDFTATFTAKYADKTATLALNNVKFAEKMPAVNFVIEGIKFTQEDSVFTLEASSVKASGGRTVGGLKGKIDTKNKVYNISFCVDATYEVLLTSPYNCSDNLPSGTDTQKSYAFKQSTEGAQKKLRFSIMNVKFFSILSVFALIFAVASCGDDNKEPQPETVTRSAQMINHIVKSASGEVLPLSESKIDYTIDRNNRRVTEVTLRVAIDGSAETTVKITDIKSETSDQICTFKGSGNGVQNLVGRFDFNEGTIRVNYDLDGTYRVISTMPEIFSTECATSCVYTDGTTSKSDGTMYQFSIDPASLTSNMTVMYLLDQSKKRMLTSVNTLTKAKVTVTKEGYVIESENTIPTKTFYKFNGKLTDTSLYPVSKLKATIDLENDKYEATMQLGTIAVTANGKVTN